MKLRIILKSALSCTYGFNIKNVFMTVNHTKTFSDACNVCSIFKFTTAMFAPNLNAIISNDFCYSR